MSHGVQVLNCGLASTPSMFMTTVDLNCDGAVQITASHHPFNRNGLKFLPLMEDWSQRILQYCLKMLRTNALYLSVAVVRQPL